jgi:hypothetical protein
MIVGNETISATLDHTPAGRDFATLLPLELSLSDHHATEKVPDLRRALDTTDALVDYTPEAGDITYYAPWGNLAILYEAFRISKGLVRPSAFDGPIDAVTVTITVPQHLAVVKAALEAGKHVYCGAPLGNGPAEEMAAVGLQRLIDAI